MASPGETGRPPNPTKIFEVASALRLPYILGAGVELDVFTAMAQGSHPADEIAQACKASQRGIRILCDSLTFMGFLIKRPACAGTRDLTEHGWRGYIPCQILWSWRERLDALYTTFLQRLD